MRTWLYAMQKAPIDNPERDFADKYPADSWPRRKLRSELADELFEAVTMRNCPYFLGKGICENGCHEEPACMVNQPIGGWTTRGPDPKRHLEIRRQSDK